MIHDAITIYNDEYIESRLHKQREIEYEINAYMRKKNIDLYNGSKYTVELEHNKHSITPEYATIKKNGMWY